MGFLDHILSKDKKRDLTELKKYFDNNTSYMDSAKIAFIREQIEENEYNPNAFFIKEDDEYINFMTTIIDSLSTFDDDEIRDIFANAEDMYNYICPFKEQTEGYEYLFKLFISMFYKNGIYSKGLFSKVLYSAFEDKKLFIEVTNLIASTSGVNHTTLPKIEEYVVRASALCASEGILKGNIINFVRNIPTSSNIDDLIDRKISDLEKYAGVYHIDKYLLSELDSKINGANSVFTRLDKLTLSINEELKLMESETEKAGATFDQVKADKLFELKQALETANTTLRLTYNDLLREARKTLASDKDSLLADFELKLSKYNKVLDDFGVNAEQSIIKVVEKIQNESKGSIEELNKLLNNDSLQELINALKDNPEFLSKVSLPTQVANVSSPTTPTEIKGNVVVTPTIVIPEKTGLIPCLDPNIPFSRRFDMVMNAKEKDIKDNKTVYHEKFDDVIALLLSESDVTPYLYGPSQCGKTHSVLQMFKLIGLPSRQIGKIIEEYNILGYNTATGSYQRTNFRDAFECGYGAFIDELDSGDQNATLIINEFLGTGTDFEYSFPDRVIKKHPNFKTIAAGNTDGLGSNIPYNARHKLDESILQRLKPVYYGYDKTIESSAIKGYEEWLEFTYEFRRALATVYATSTSNSSKIIAGNVTTKDLYVIAEWLRNKQFGDKTMSKIIEYQFVTNKSDKILAELANEMSKFYSSSRSSSRLYSEFSDQVELIRTRGR